MRCFYKEKTMAKLEKIAKRDGKIVDFDKEKIVNAIFKAAVEVGGEDRRLAEILADKVVHQLELSQGSSAYHTVEDIQDIIEKELIEAGHARTAKAFILFRHDRDKRREENDHQKLNFDGNIPYKKIWQVLNWSVDHNCYSVDKINERIKNGTYPELVKEVTAKYDADVEAAAQKIIDRGGKVRIVIVHLNHKQHHLSCLPSIVYHSFYV